MIVLYSVFGCDRNLSPFFRFWVIFRAVFRFFIDPNAPLTIVLVNISHQLLGIEAK